MITGRNLASYLAPLLAPRRGRLKVTLSLPAEPLEAVCELRTSVTLVRELRDQQRERLRVPGDPQGPSIDRIETHVADQLSGDPFAARIIPAVDEAGFPGLAPSRKDAKQHFARHRVERRDDPRLRHLLRQCLRA